MNVLVIGSSVIDLFIKLDPDHFEIGDKKVTFALGDKVPSEIKKSALGGNGANVSVGLNRLETPTTLYTYLGNDFFSQEIEAGLSREGVELDIERHEDTSSPLHIILDFPDDRVILSNYSKNRHGFSPKTRDFDFLFLTSVPDFWEEAYRKILLFANENNISIAFSPGTRQIKEKNDLVINALKSSKIYFSNREEALRLVNSKLEMVNREDIKKLLLEIKQLGPEVASITDGPNGAYALDRENNYYFITPAPSKGTEKTGAGDAYASGFFSGYLLDNNIPECMRWGALNASFVMREMGAQNGLLTKKNLDEQLREYNNFRAENI